MGRSNNGLGLGRKLWFWFLLKPVGHGQSLGSNPMDPNVYIFSPRKNLKSVILKINPNVDHCFGLNNVLINTLFINKY